MPIDLDDVAADVCRTIAFWGDSEVQIGYRPSVITTRRVQQIRSAKESDDTVFLKFLCDVLAEWDVTRKGEAVPINPEGMKDIPLAFIRAIVMTIMQDSGRNDSGKA